MKLIPVVLLLACLGFGQTPAEQCASTSFLDSDHAPFYIWWGGALDNRGECERWPQYFHQTDPNSVVEVTQEEYAQQTCTPMISDGKKKFLYPLKEWKHCKRNKYAGSGMVTSAGTGGLTGATWGTITIRSIQ